MHLDCTLQVFCTHRNSDTAYAAGDLHLIYTRLVTRRQGFEFSSRCERATHLALPMCGFERVAALILEPVSKGADVIFFSSRLRLSHACGTAACGFTPGTYMLVPFGALLYGTSSMQMVSCNRSRDV